MKVQNLKTGWWYGYFSGDSIRISENNFDVLLKPGEYELYTTIRLPAPASGFITTSNKDLFEENVDIVLFPNPTDRFINFNYNGPKLENVSLVLIDVTGKQLISLIYNETIENGYFNQFDLKDYPVGIYFLNLFSKESQKTFLLSKNY